MNDRKLILGAVFCWLLTVPAIVAVAQTPPGGDIDPTAAGSQLVDAIAGGQWGIAIGAGVMLLVWALRVFLWPSVPTKVLPWLAVALAVLGTGATALVSEPSKWLAAIWAGVQAGLAAAGAWGLIGKHVLPVKDK